MSESFVPVRGGATLHEVPDTGETVLCDVDGGVMLVLNDTGVAVWHLTDGQRTVDEIASVVASTTGAPEEIVQTDVRAFLTSLREHGLVSSATR